MRRRSLIAPALAALLLLTGCTETGLQPDRTVDGVSEWTRPAGNPVSFSGRTVDGSTFRSSDHRGEVLVVNFWYQDCPPCNREAPVLKQTAARFAGKGVQFVGINVEDGEADAAAFERRFGIAYPSILDQDNDGAARLAFQGTVPPSAIPSTVVLGRDGRPTGRILGAVASDDASTLRSLISTALDRTTT